MEKTLNDLKVGQPAVITDLNCKGTVRRRIIDLGLTPGVSVVVLRTAPMGDPLEIRIRGFNMSIRRSDAGKINVATNY
ncbi:MAG: FeoA family protein [Oscillospiraceae bacterium]|jgi:Fe2+ transport system protein FeoA|nr:FeoA family protein [Oscillospiraceae bacterium]MDD3832404.1 FeoA family protein [Oscillospiraceae bacterium]MDD4545988.1 FeoA family protein [Oscillospiraceae bacterium]